MDDVVKILKDAGAVLEGHFIGTSGKHLPIYINKDAFLPDTATVSKICRMFAELNAGKDIEVVVGPAIGGIVLSTWTAHHLSEITGKKVLSLFTEKTPENGQIFKRGYDNLVKGKRVLAVEDTVTTGGSVKKTIDAVQAAGGIVTQLSLILNRDPQNVNGSTFGVPVNALGELPLESYEESEVPDWLKKIPINTELGHGKKYLETHPESV